MKLTQILRKALSSSAIILKNAAKGWIDHSTQREAAAIAFYAIFSVIPMMMIGARIAGVFIGRDAASSEVVELVDDYVGMRAAELTQTILNQRVLTTDRPWGGIFMAVAIVFWASTQIFMELRYALNRIWGISSESVRQQIFRYIKGHLLGLLMVISIGLILPLFLLLSTFVATLLAFVETSSPMDQSFWMFWNEIVTLVVAFLIFTGLMKFLPSEKIKLTDILPGSIVAALIFTASKSLIGEYLSHSFVATLYSTTSSIVLIFIWIYLATMIILFGVEISRAYAIEYGSLSENSLKNKSSEGLPPKNHDESK